jgi:hypothetical protein
VFSSRGNVMVPGRPQSALKREDAASRRLYRGTVVYQETEQAAYNTLSWAYPAAASAEISSAIWSGPRVSIVMSIAVSPRLTP